MRRAGVAFDSTTNLSGIRSLDVVVETGDSAAIFERPQHPYTRALMAAAFEIKAEESAVRT